MCRHQLLPLLVLTLVLSVVPARPSQAQWQVNGAPVCTAANTQHYSTIVSDGAGGAIVTWLDSRSATQYDVYAQRVDAAGVAQWTGDGVALCTAVSGKGPPAIVSDGAGGAIVTWPDYRNGTEADIYAQRVSAAGAPQWTTDGVALCSAAGQQFLPTIASDGAGGAIVTWYDNGSSIYTQRVNAAGMPQWTANGVALSTGTSANYFTAIVSDGAGGAIVTWQDFRNGTSWGIYAQRVNAAGAPQWTVNGVALSAAANITPGPRIASDGSGGAIVTWVDIRSDTSSHIYARRVSATGVPQWTTDGVALCTDANDQGQPTIASDGAGGAIITWGDGRSDGDIYAQRVSAAGTPQWSTDGVALCKAAGGQGPPMIVSDGAGGAIVAWDDRRNGTSQVDIYAQRVYGSGGVVAVPPPSAPAHFRLLAPSPNPSRDGQLTIRFSLQSSERVSAQVLDVQGHRVRTLATDRQFSPGTQVLDWDGRNNAGVSLPNGVYFVEVRVGTHSEARRAILLH